MSAFLRAASIDEDHAASRRWWFSALVAAGLHGAIAMAALSWHVTSQPAGTNGSSASSAAVFIDLTPLPAARSPEQTLPPLNARNTAADEREKDMTRAASPANRDSSAESLGLQQTAAESWANGPVAEAPIAPVPPDTARDTGAGAAASDAFAAGVVEKSPAEVSHGFRVDPGPLDTSITVLPPPFRPRLSFGVFTRNRMILLRPKHPGNAESSNHPLGKGPGAHIQDRVNADIERQNLNRIERARNGSTMPATNSLGMKNGTSSSVHDNSKNAIGATTANNGNGGAESGVVNSSTRDAVGMTIQVHPAPHGTNVEEQRQGIAGLKGREGITGLKTAIPPGDTGLKAAASPPGILNGRGTPRSGTSLTLLGGAPKTVPGSLSGSDFHPKHQQ